jgi:hypothetical protein
MDSQSYRAILKRVGVVLVVSGVVDIGWMVYCIIQGFSYRSSFNLFAVIAGILLMRGNLRAAVIIRWFGVFFVAASLTLFFTWPALRPMDPTLTAIRLHPMDSIAGAAFTIFVVALLYWCVRELGRDAVQAATNAAGVKRRSMRNPGLLGVVLVIGLEVALHFFLGGESAQRAISMAEQQVGPGYQFVVSSLRISSGGGSESVSGVVTVWNDKEVREIPVQWESRN